MLFKVFSSKPTANGPNFVIPIYKHSLIMDYNLQEILLPSSWVTSNLSLYFVTPAVSGCSNLSVVLLQTL